MTPEELSDLLDKLSPDTLTAVRADLIAAQPLTAEEKAYFDAEADLTEALEVARASATKALKSQEEDDLWWASFYFKKAGNVAQRLAAAELAMQSAFRKSDEYAAQVEAQL